MNRPIAKPAAAAPIPGARPPEACQTPGDIYGALFERVQMLRIFPDSKTFADAVPRRAPRLILADFAARDPQTPDAVRAFVEANFDVPSAVTAISGAPDPASLSAHIANLWAGLERPAQVAVEGSSALPLGEAFVVPGGRFREIYYWDSYFTMLGLAHDGRNDLVESMLHNFEHLIERFGHIPNGTRTYYLSRSQPPFLSLMAGLSQTTGEAERRRQLNALQNEYAYWMAGASEVSADHPAAKSVVRLPDGGLLNRYWDDRDTPRDESFAEDVETARHSGRAAAEVYRDLRAGAASGWDFSSRWFAEPDDLGSIRTTAILPVDLNALLWTLESEIAARCIALGDEAGAQRFEALADARAKAIHRYLWNAEDGCFSDYDYMAGRATPVLSAATLYPLFLGLATPVQAETVAATTRDKLMARGGLRTTTRSTGQQWDAPNGWAPLQWIAVVGLARYGFDTMAHDIAARWLTTVDTAYRETGKILEKYDVDELRPGGGGEYPLQDGFGWTNGVTRALLAKYPDLAEGR